MSKSFSQNLMCQLKLGWRHEYLGRELGWSQAPFSEFDVQVISHHENF